MLRRLLLAMLLMGVTTLAEAVISYNDVWVDKDELGYGVFLVQSNTFQFLAFFIYDQNKQPTWYTAQLTDDGTGNYTGFLYATVGTYFASPWNPSDHPDAVQVGTVTFAPIDIYHATLTYTVNGVGTIVKPLQRQTLTSLVLGGNYSGSVAGTAASCTNPADNNAISGRFNLAVVQNGEASATLTFTFVDTTYNGMVCTWSGPLNHFGNLYQLSPGQYACTMQGFSTGAPTSASIESLHPTGQGVEGRWVVNTSTGCVQTIHFTAVLK